MEPAQTAQLVRQTLAGNKNAFSALVEEHQHTAFSLAMQQSACRADAEDITQEAFLRAYKYLGRLRKPELFAGWFYSIVINVAREQRRARRHTVPIESIPEPAGPDVDPTAKSTLGEVMDKVAGLPPKYRVPLTMRYGRGLKYAEIARILGIHETAARSRVHRARRLLR